MKQNLFIVILILAALVISACAGTPTPSVNETPGSAPTEAAPSDPTPVLDYPAPEDPYGYGYPADGAAPEEMPAGSALPLESAPWSALPPVADDAALQRGNFVVDRFEMQQGQDGQASLFVEGSLPTPCNAPRAQVSQPDGSNQITIELYSVIDPDKMCTQVIQPFSGIVATFTDMPAGQYQVILNGEAAGQFTVQ